MPSNTFPLWKPYSSFSVRVPNDAAPHQILALMRAADPNCAERTKYWTIQSDPLRSTANALIGEKATDDQNVANPVALSATNYGVVLLAGGSETFGGFWDEYVNLARFWVLNDGTGAGGVLFLCVQAARG